MVKLVQFISYRISIHCCSINIYDMKMTVWHGPILEASIGTKKCGIFKVRKWSFSQKGQILTLIFKKRKKSQSVPVLENTSLKRTYVRASKVTPFLAEICSKCTRPFFVTQIFWCRREIHPLNDYMATSDGQWFESRIQAQIFWVQNMF